MTGSRFLNLIRALALAGAVFALCAAAAQAQDLPGLPGAGDPTETTGDGNSAGQSVGVVQVGPATIDPAGVAAGTPAGPAVAGAGATVGRSGGNHTSQSGGVVQAGGSNSATRALGAVQVASSKAGTGARVDRLAGTTVTAGIAGAGGNTTRSSVGTIQLGSGNDATGTTGAVQIDPTTAAVRVHVTGLPGAGGDVAVSGDGLLGDTLGVDLSRLGLLPGRATMLVLSLVRSLGLPPTPPGALQLVDSGVLQVGRGGDDVRVDLGTLTVQVVSLDREPSLSLDVLGTHLALGAVAAVPNTGAPVSSGSLGVAQVGGGNVALGSIGVAQVGSFLFVPALELRSEELGTSLAAGGVTSIAGGGNSSNGSIGVVQIGSLDVSPRATLAVDGIGSLDLGGSNGIAGNGNSAGSSIGVVQIGGGNAANGSTGVVQAGTLTLAPAGTLDALGSRVVLGGSTGIGGGGNTADSSIGAVQIGGGNASTGSLGTLQSNAVELGPTVTAGGTTIAPNTDLGGTGSGPGNAATGSVGVVQVGTANDAGDSIGVAQAGGSSVGGGPGTGGTGGAGTPSTGGGRTPSTGASEADAADGRNAPAGTTAPPTGPGSIGTAVSAFTSGPPAMQSPTAPFRPPAAATASPGVPVLGSDLPFTGLPVWIALLAALGLLASGSMIRRAAHR